MPIFAESETLFFYRAVEATLEFEKDASGAVTGVRLRQGPINTLAPRKNREQEKGRSGGFCLISISHRLSLNQENKSPDLPVKRQR